MQRLRAAVLVSGLLLGVLALPAASASAATQTAGAARLVAAAPSQIATVNAAATVRKLNITMQAQQYSNWCWAASGNTVAAYFGYSYSQNQFCNMAFDRAINSSCPNNQATLGNDQEAFWQMGLGQGNYVNGYLYYNTVISEIDGSRPIITRIQWQSGGGHMMVIYGYDKNQSWVYWGNPWGSSPRYNWGTYNYYVNNSSFFWTHSLYRIGL